MAAASSHTPISIICCNASAKLVDSDFVVKSNGKGPTKGACVDAESLSLLGGFLLRGGVVKSGDTGEVPLEVGVLGRLVLVMQLVAMAVAVAVAVAVACAAGGGTLENDFPTPGK